MVRTHDAAALSCRACELDGGPFDSTAEAAHLATIHNTLHHGSHPVASSWTSPLSTVEWPAGPRARRRARRRRRSVTPPYLHLEGPPHAPRRHASRRRGRRRSPVEPLDAARPRELARPR